MTKRVAGRNGSFLEPDRENGLNSENLQIIEETDRRVGWNRKET